MFLSALALALLAINRVHGMCEMTVDDCCPQPGITFTDCPTPNSKRILGGRIEVGCCQQFFYDGSGPERYWYDDCPFVIHFTNVNIPAGTVLRVASIYCTEGCKIAHITEDNFGTFSLRVNGGSFGFSFTGVDPPTFNWEIVGKGCPCAGGCDPGWRLFQGVCYHVIQCFDTWDNQKASCEGLGASLIPIKDQATMNFIDSYSGPLTWIGMRTYDGGDTWNFVDGDTLSPNLNFWDPGHPIKNLNRHCAETSVDGVGLSTQHCNVHSKAICCKDAEE